MSGGPEQAPAVLRRGLEQGDVELIISALSPDAVLHSPAAARLEFRGETELRALFEATTAAYEDLIVVRDFGNEREWLLSLQARIGAQRFTETLLLALDESGRITELRPSIRPLAGLAVVAAEIGSKIARRRGLGRSLALRGLMAPITQMAKSGEGIGPKLIGTGESSEQRPLP